MVDIYSGSLAADEPGSESVLSRLVTHVSDLQDALALLSARSIAQQCAVQALIATHPDPQTLLDHFVLQVEPAKMVQTPNLKVVFTREILQLHERIQGAIDII